MLPALFGEKGIGIEAEKPCFFPSLACFIEKVGIIVLQQSKRKDDNFDDFFSSSANILFILLYFNSI